MQKPFRARAYGCVLVSALLATLVLPPVASAAVACPDRATFMSKTGAAVLDLGWTGATHNLAFPGWNLRLAFTNCTETAGGCGTCSVTALPDARRASRRCAVATWVSCVSDADCAAGGATGPCREFASAPMPISGAGFGACVMNAIAGPVTGSVNVAQGAAAVRVPLGAVLYGGTADVPCPRCVRNDQTDPSGTAGTCDSGPRRGESCGVQASAAVPSFGGTSLDCPPADADRIGVLTRASDPLLLTTGSQVVALEAGSPSCRESAFLDRKCTCDVCANDASRPCQSSRDCNGALCGSGEGAESAPNNCTDGVCTAISADKGVCRKGPFDARCGPVDTFRGCRSDDDCPYGGDHCRTQLRNCFPNTGKAGESIRATGQPDAKPDTGGEPVLAGLFCIPPTTNALVNSVVGLPGLGRLTLSGTLNFHYGQGSE